MNALSLILVIGSAGSGKTTFSLQLVPKLRCVYLNTDLIADLAFPGDRDSPAYIRARPMHYRALYSIAFANLKVGNSVLLDAPHVTQMRDAEWRAWIAAQTDAAGARLRIIRCFSDQATRRMRIATRGEVRDARKLRNWSDQLSSEDMPNPLPLPHIEIDTCADMERNIALAMDYLRGP